jgi:hexosaminidase
MIDNGRKYFTPKWIAREIRRLSYLKLNRLHLHFSDNEGFRIESHTHPEAVSDPHLTQKQLKSLVALGRRYHVELIPEIDMPGHMRAALAKHPELQLADVNGQKAPDKLDYTKPEARKFARELIGEYMRVFPAREWHIGADEFLSVILPPTPADYARYPQLQAYAKQTYGPTANAKDGFLGFVNDLAKLARDHGKTPRVWNDGIDGGSAVKLRPDIVVEWWNNPAGPGTGPGPQDWIDAGHPVLNAGWFPTYYVSGGTTSSVPPRPDMAWAYEDWDVNRFLGAYYTSREAHEPEFVLAPGERLNRGSELHVWNDDPSAETEAEIAAGIAPRLRVIAQKTWGTPLLVPAYADFERLAARVGSG